MAEMNWVQRKIYLYNVTFGLYMLDWWERGVFNTLVIVLMWFVLRYIIEFFKRPLVSKATYTIQMIKIFHESVAEATEIIASEAQS